MAELTGKLAAEFDDWYYGGEHGGYIRKKKRGEAKKAFAQMRPLVSMEKLCAGRDAYARHHKVEGTPERFLLHPASWLRGECWDDEYPEVETPAHMKAYEDWTDTQKRWTADMLAKGVEARNMRLTPDIEGRLHAEGYMDKLRVVG